MNDFRLEHKTNETSVEHLVLQDNYKITKDQCVLVPQSCPTLCDPTDCSPPGSSVHGILQARILEWIRPVESCQKELVNLK